MFILDVFGVEPIKYGWNGKISTATTAAELEAPFPGTGSQLPPPYTGVLDAAKNALVAGTQEVIAGFDSTVSVIMPDSGSGSLREDWEKSADEWRARARSRAPDPMVATKAALMTYDVFKDMTKVVESTTLGAGVTFVTKNPRLGFATGASVYGLNMGIQEAADLKKLGVDRQTALKAGALRAGTSVAGYVIPGAIPFGRVASAAYGVISNAGLGLSDRWVAHWILENADYSDAAERYAPDDPWSLAVDIIIGGGIGFLGGKLRKPVDPLRKLSEIQSKTEPERLQMLAEQRKERETAGAGAEARVSEQEEFIVPDQAEKAAQPEQVQQEAEPAKQEPVTETQPSAQENAIAPEQGKQRVEEPTQAQEKALAEKSEPKPVKAEASKREPPEQIKEETLPEEETATNTRPEETPQTEQKQAQPEEPEQPRPPEQEQASQNAEPSGQKKTESSLPQKETANEQKAPGTAEERTSSSPPEKIDDETLVFHKVIPSGRLGFTQLPVHVSEKFGEGKLGDEDGLFAMYGYKSKRAAALDVIQNFDLIVKIPPKAPDSPPTLLLAKDPGRIGEVFRFKNPLYIEVELEEAGKVYHAVAIKIGSLPKERVLFDRSKEILPSSELSPGQMAERKKNLKEREKRQKAARARKKRKPTQEEADAARILVTNEANRVNTLVDPGNQEKLSRAYEAQAIVAEQMESGKRVSVPDGTVDVNIADLFLADVRVGLSSEMKKRFADYPETSVRKETETVSTLTLTDAVKKDIVFSDENIRVFLRTLNNTVQASDPPFEWITVGKEADGREHRVYGLRGNPDLNVAPSGVSGIKPLPIRLQEDTVRGGHLDRHLAVLRAAGYNSSLEAVADIAQNFSIIYEPSKEFLSRKTKSGKQREGIVLARPIFMTTKEASSGDEPVFRGVLLTELQEEAGCYRIGQVLATDHAEFLKNRKILWEKTPPIRERGSMLPTLPPELTEPEYTPSVGILGEKVGTVNEMYQASLSKEFEEAKEKITFLKDELSNTLPEDRKVQEEAVKNLENDPDMVVTTSEDGSPKKAVDYMEETDRQATKLEDVSEHMEEIVDCLWKNKIIKL